MDHICGDSACSALSSPLVDVHEDYPPHVGMSEMTVVERLIEQCQGDGDIDSRFLEALEIAMKPIIATGSCVDDIRGVFRALYWWDAGSELPLAVASAILPYVIQCLHSDDSEIVAIGLPALHGFAMRGDVAIQHLLNQDILQPLVQLYLHGSVELRPALAEVLVALASVQDARLRCLEFLLEGLIQRATATPFSFHEQRLLAKLVAMFPATFRKVRNL